MKVYNKQHAQRKAANIRKEALKFKDGKGKERAQAAKKKASK